MILTMAVKLTTTLRPFNGLLPGQPG